MRRTLIFFVTILLMAVLVTGCGKKKDEGTAAAMPKEFSATIESSSGGQTVTSKIYIKPDKFRTDTKMAGSSTIVRKDLNKVWTLITSQKTYMEMPGVTDTQLPVTADEQVKGEVSRTKVGSESINGHPATKYEVTVKTDDKVTKIYQWWATDTNFPIKTAAVDGSWSMEYRDVEIGSQPDSLFEIPSGYKKMTIPKMP